MVISKHWIRVFIFLLLIPLTAIQIPVKINVTSIEELQKSSAQHGQKKVISTKALPSPTNNSILLLSNDNQTQLELHGCSISEYAIVDVIVDISDKLSCKKITKHERIQPVNSIVRFNNTNNNSNPTYLITLDNGKKFIVSK